MFNEIVLDHNSKLRGNKKKGAKIAFNLSFISPFADQPHNPMVNSGAIMSASILLHLLKPEMNVAQKYDYVFDFFKVEIEFSKLLLNYEF